MRIALTLLFVAATVAGSATATQPQRGIDPPDVTFASGAKWFADPAGPQAPGSGALPGTGPAQLVCLNQFAPVGCPSGATLWGYGGFAWPADLTPIPGAHWIWAPGFEGNDTGADLAAFLFSRRLHLPDWPSAGTMFIAADDFAAVYVNGVLSGTVGSVVDTSLNGQAALTQLDITGLLRPGWNKIRVLAENGPAWFAGVCSGPCTYAENPAGVVFGGTISFA